MAKKKKTKKTNKGSNVEKLAEEIVKTISEDSPQNKECNRWVVVRDDIRVSDKEYTSPNDPEALSEFEFWDRVVKNWSPKEMVSIIPFDRKKHRVW